MGREEWGGGGGGQSRMEWLLNDKVSLDLTLKATGKHLSFLFVCLFICFKEVD